jgi:hypothetical protein
MLNPQRLSGGGVSAAWRNVVLYDEHTWGAHNSISQPDAPFVKSQWAIKQAFALEADKQSHGLLEKALATRRTTSEANHSVDVFNTTSWTRSRELVTVTRELALSGDAVTDSNGKPVPSQRLASGELAFLASDVPPFAAKRYRISVGSPFAEGAAKADGTTLRTSQLSLKFDKETGAIVRLRCRSVDADLVDAKGQTALNDYFYLPGSDLRPEAKPGENLGKGPCWRHVDRVRRRAVTSLSANASCGRRRAWFHQRGGQTGCSRQEGVHFGFAFNVPGGMRMDVPWGMIRPEKDQLPGACKNWITVGRWVDVSNDEYGVTWATLDAPLVEVGGITANLISSLSIRAPGKITSRRRKPSTRGR